MSAVLKFPTPDQRLRMREAAVASEVTRVAAVKGYCSRSAIDGFRRNALAYSRQRPDLAPSSCAARCVPDKSSTWGGPTPPEAA